MKVQSFQDLWKRFVKQVHNQIRFAVDQDQIAARDAVCQFLRYACSD
jgi:hypothetical protein